MNDRTTKGKLTTKATRRWAMSRDILRRQRLSEHSKRVLLTKIWCEITTTEKGKISLTETMTLEDDVIEWVKLFIAIYYFKDRNYK